jgi:A/G-specific adenine glycosylase
VVDRLSAWFAENARELPWRRVRDPYGVWVSEIMLQQTQVRTVVPYFERWMRALPNVAALARASSKRIHKLWEGLGYYTRVRNMQRAAKRIVAEHGGKFPERFEDVLELPGIGRYTAGAICSIAFQQPQPILDGNVIRVLARVFGVAGNPKERATNEQLWGVAEALVKEAGETPGIFNQALMELGALICTPRQPRCELCPIAKNCVAFQSDRVQELPESAKRPRATEKFFHAFVAKRRGRFLVRQRPDGVVNGHLWEFPNVEVKGPVRGKKPFCTIKHSITRYRITLEVFQINGNRAFERRFSEGRWLTLNQLRALPFSSAHKRILQQL